MQKPNYFIISGAGLSAESGLHTYRQSGGIWTEFDPDKVCTWPRFIDHRAEGFQFFEAIRNAVNQASPNEAHKAIAKFQNRLGQDRVQVITQNIDDLLERAGCLNVIHLHGDLSGYNCKACGTNWAKSVDTAFLEGTRCPKCNSLRGVKPSVIMFGEVAPNYAYLNKMHKNIKVGDVVIVIGTSYNVLCEHTLVPTLLHGSINAIEVNLESSAELGIFGRSLQGNASEVLPPLLEAFG